MGYRIRNWKRHQHFKDRRPPWIKLYRELLEDPDWGALSGEDAKTLVGLWLVASEHDGSIPCLRKAAYKMRISEAELIAQVERLGAWLIRLDDNLISTCQQVGPSETETERETDNKADPKPLGSRARGTEKPTACIRTQEPNAEPAEKRTETARPATTSPKPVSPGPGTGTGQHRAIPGIRLPRPNIERIMALTQDLPVYRAFWIETERRLLAAGHGSDLHEWLQKIDDCQNPVTRELKGYGEELKQPAKWLYRQAKDALGQNMPRLPKKEDTNVNIN